MIAHGQDREIARLRARVSQLSEAVMDLEQENSRLERELDMERTHSRTMGSALERVEAQLSEFVLEDAA